MHEWSMHAAGETYGRKCAASMSDARRADNAEHVRASDYALESSPTRDFWRGFVSAMESTPINRVTTMRADGTVYHHHPA